MDASTFWDNIYDLRKRRLIPRQWTRNDLHCYLSQKYTPNTINTVPSNQSMTRDGSKVGNYVRRGREAKAWRVGSGKFELICDPADLPHAGAIAAQEDLYDTSSKPTAGGGKLLEDYVSCLMEVLKRGWADEVRENRERPNISTINRVEFFHQYAYCVFTSNIKEKIIRERWPDLTRAFKGWDYEKIHQNRQQVEIEAIQVFANKRKIEAILKCAHKLSQEGWEKFKGTLVQTELWNQLNLLDELPGIGKAARYQLAGAIGIDVAKPDRHLLRLASKYSYGPTEEGVQEFAGRVARLVGERVKVVDYVFWRFSEGSYNQK